MTRAPSPEIIHIPSVDKTGHLPSICTPVAFPFSVTPARVSTKSLLARLPPKDEAWTLVEAYYKYCAWHHDVAPKERFIKTFERIYALSSGLAPSPRVNPQEIALLFVLLSQGTRYNIEMAFGDESAEDWLQLAELALVKGHFMSNNMVAGIQTLVGFTLSACLMDSYLADVLEALDGSYAFVRLPLFMLLECA